MRRNLVIGLVAVAAVAGLLFVLARGPGAPGPEAPTAAAPAKKTLRVGIVTLPADRGYPWNTTGIPNIFTHRAMFDGLTYVTEDGEVQPFLATAWEPVDPITWRFTLREGVTFHNGAPFTADAVVFAVNHMVAPENLVDLTARELADLASAEAEGPHSVIIRTKKPSPLLPAALELMVIIEPGAFTQLGREGFAAAPVGTGPFKLVGWSANGAEFEAFKDSWRAPKVDALQLIEVPDKSARVQALLSGRIDVAVSLGYEDVKAIEAAGGQAYVGKDASVLGVTFVITKLPPGHPLRDKRVRQALNYAVDKEAYIQALFGGLTAPASQPAVPSSFGYNPDLKPYPYDPAKAKALLAEAGYPDGFSFLMEVPAGGGASLEEVYQKAAADLANVGVKMTLQAISVPQLNRGVLQGEWTGQAFGMNYSAQRTTDSLRAMRLHSCLHPQAWYCNQDLQPLIVEAMTTGDLDTRRRLSQQIMAAYHDEAPAIWLHRIVTFEGLSPKVRNFRADVTVIRYDLIELAD
jgi:peptide/nickel transport system substrate-binding protein